MPSTGFPEKIGVSSTGFERRKGLEKKPIYSIIRAFRDKRHPAQYIAPEKGFSRDW